MNLARMTPSLALILASSPVFAGERPALSGPDPQGWVKASEGETIDLGTPSPSASPSGALTYGVPIEVPVGRRGMQPSIALSYSSMGGDGLLGKGWSLSGFPAIVRVSDGQGRTYGPSDGYALVEDVTQPTPHADGFLRRTTGLPDRYLLTRDNGSRFDPEPSQSACGFDPCFWVMRDGAGNAYYFGGNATHHPGLGEESHVLFDDVDGQRGIDVWGLYRVVDADGNGYQVDYLDAARRLLPETVTYPIQSGPTPPANARRVRLVYGARPESPLLPFGLPQRILTEIRSFAGTTELTRYVLHYQPGNSPISGRPLLVSVDRPGHPRLSFAYEDAPTEHLLTGTGVTSSKDFSTEVDANGHPLIGERFLKTSATSPARGVSNLGLEGYLTATADVNGDGHADVIRATWHFVAPVGGIHQHYENLYIEQALGSPTGLSAFSMVHADHRRSASISTTEEVGRATLSVGDLDGDGTSDAILALPFGDGVGIRAFMGDRASGLSSQQSLSVTFSALTTDPYRQDITPLSGALVGDVDRDGADDIVVYNPVVRAATTVAGGPGLDLATAQTTTQLWYPSSGWPVSRNPCQLSAGAPCSAYDEVYFRGASLSDVDGDEYLDFVAMYSSGFTRTAGAARIRRAVGRGLPRSGAGLVFLPIDEFDFTPNTTSARAQALLNPDLNGDGRADAVLLFHGRDGPLTYPEGAPGENVPFRRQVHFLTGTVPLPSGLSAHEANQDSSGRPLPFPDLDYSHGLGAAHYDARTSSPSSFTPVTGDFDGDGREEIADVYRGAMGTHVDVIASDHGHNAHDWANLRVTTAHHDADAHTDSEAERWHATRGDLNGDGIHDLVLWQLGPSAQSILRVEVMFGRAGLGLQGPPELYAEISSAGSEPSWLANNAIIEVADNGVPYPALARRVFPALHLADVNGDGVDDILVGENRLDGASEWRQLLSHRQGGQDAPATPDLLVRIDNGYGGSFEARYAPSRFAPGIDGVGPAAPDEGCRAADVSCGRADLRHRPLLVGLIADNGRTLDAHADTRARLGARMERVFRYRSGRWLPGIGAEARQLGFAIVESGERVPADSPETAGLELELAATSARAEFRQQPLFENLVERRQQRDWAGHLINVQTHTYAPGVVHQGPPESFRIDLTDTSVRLLESGGTQGIPIGHRQITMMYDALGRMTSERVCAGPDASRLDDCELTVRSYLLDEPNWVTSFVRWERAVDVETGLLLGATRQDPAAPWDYTRASAVHRLLFDDAKAATCSAGGSPPSLSFIYEDELCPTEVNGGSVRWVTEERVDQWDTYGHATHVRDAAGALTVTSYEPTLGIFPESVRGPYGLTATQSHDPFGRKLSATDPNGHTTTWRYDAAGRLEAELPPLPGAAAGTERSSTGWVGWGQPRLDTAAPQHRLVTGRASQGDAQSVRTYFDGLGAAMATEQPFMGQTRFTEQELLLERDPGRPFHWVRRQTAPYFCASLGACPGDREWRYVRLDPRGRPLEVRQRSPRLGAGNARDVVASYEYAGRDSIVQAGQLFFLRYIERRGGDDIETRYSYDYRYRWREIYTKNDTPAGLDWAKTTFDYDHADRVEGVTLPDYYPDDLFRPAGTGQSRTIEYDYDSWGRVKRERHWQTGETLYDYDDLGRVIRAEDAEGHVVSTSYDLLGRVDQIQHDGLLVADFEYDLAPGGLGRLYRTYSYGLTTHLKEVLGYDSLGQPTGEEVTFSNLFPSGPRTFSFNFDHDWQGRLGAVDMPNGKTVTHVFAPDMGPEIELRYDGQRVATYQDLDALGRPKHTVFENGVTTSRSFDPITQTAKFLKVESPTSLFVDEEYVYDRGGHLSERRDLRGCRWVGAGPACAPTAVSSDRTLSFTYGIAVRGRLREVSGPTYGTERFRTEAGGELVLRGDRTLSTNQDLHFASFPRQQGMLYLGHEIYGKLGSQPVATRPSSYDFRATHDLRGLRVTEENALTAKDLAHVYDAAGRVFETVVFEHGTGVIASETRYGYDTARQRVAKTVDDFASGKATLTAYVGHGYEVRVDLDRALESQTLLLSSAYGLVATVTEGDPLPRQGDPLNPQLEAPLHGSASDGPARGMVFHHLDAQGSPILLTNAQGTEVARYAYKPFGGLRTDASQLPARRELISSGLDATPRRYTGHEHDAATDLLYANARYYDPFSGRFLTPDLVTPGFGFEPMGFNRYTYTLGDPTNFTDPDGREPVTISAALLWVGKATAQTAADALIDGAFALMTGTAPPGAVGHLGNFATNLIPGSAFKYVEKTARFGRAARLIANSVKRLDGIDPVQLAKLKNNILSSAGNVQDRLSDFNPFDRASFLELKGALIGVVGNVRELQVVGKLRDRGARVLDIGKEVVLANGEKTELDVLFEEGANVILGQVKAGGSTIGETQLRRTLDYAEELRAKGAAVKVRYYVDRLTKPKRLRLQGLKVEVVRNQDFLQQ